MDYGVRRAADGAQRSDRVLERGPAEDLRARVARARAGRLRDRSELRGGASRRSEPVGWSSPRQRDPECRAISAIVDAVPITVHVPAVLKRVPSSSPMSSSVSVPARCSATIAGSRCMPRAAGRPRSRGSTGPRRRGSRHLDHGRRHQLDGNRLIAATEEHDRVHRLRADQLLGLHREHVAVQHRGR